MSAGFSLGVKLAVSEPQKLGERVQEALEQRKEPNEPDHQADGAELHETLEEEGYVEGSKHGETVVQDGRGVLRAEEPYGDRERDGLAAALEEE